MLSSDLQKLLSQFPNGEQFIGTIPNGRFYLVDYKTNPKMVSSSFGNIIIVNNTHVPLSIIAFDEFVTSNRKNPSGCDYLISKDNCSDYIVLCELKDIRADYLNKTNDAAVNQLINSYDFLSSIKIICNYRYVFGIMGIKLKNSNDNIRRSFKAFTQHSYRVLPNVKTKLKNHGFTDVFANFKVSNDPPFVASL